MVVKACNLFKPLSSLLPATYHQYESEVIKKFSQLITKSRVFDWSETCAECKLTNENPEFLDWA
jgi:hypothetical protein